jgi:hypothetical protein
MNTSVKRGYIYFPADWEHIESKTIGPFVTRIVHRRPDGSEDMRTSRRHRKRFGSAGSEGKRPLLLLWRLTSLNWWIALLFMIGSLHFAVGSVLVLAGSAHIFLINSIYFVGSLFFTSAGYSQYYQAINAPEAVDGNGRTLPISKRRYFAWQPQRIGFWATFPQFLGTIAFNFNTFNAFIAKGWLGYDVLIWAPDFVGSVLFLISGTTAVFEFCHRFYCWQSHNLTWWIVIINFAGCVAFMLSAFAAFVRPNPVFANLAIWSTLFTLIGAICFFVGAYLMWPEMAIEAQ